MEFIRKQISESKALLGGVAMVFLALVACNSTQNPVDSFDTVVPRFIFEDSSPEAMSKVVSLPVSGVRIQVNPQIALSEYDVASIEIAEVEYGKCLQFLLTPAAKRDFYRTSALHQGKRLVLLLNGKAMGVRKIDKPISDGNILIFLEVADEDLPEIAKNLKGTIFEAQKKLNS